jgi:cytosine/uracil/thiamine/allantoin permease
VTAFPEWIAHLYNYAWFVGFLVSGLVYLFCMKDYKVNKIVSSQISEHVSTN